MITNLRMELFEALLGGGLPVTVLTVTQIAGVPWPVQASHGHRRHSMVGTNVSIELCVLNISTLTQYNMQHFNVHIHCRKLPMLLIQAKHKETLN